MTEFSARASEEISSPRSRMWHELNDVLLDSSLHATMSRRDSFAPSIRDSFTSSSRLSALLSAGSSGANAATSSSTGGPSSTFPIPQSSPSLPPLPPNSKRTAAIYDRPVTRSRGQEVSLGAWAFLFGEIIQYTQRRVSGISEFEKT